ncbi:MAG TPA: two-component regulator propeller domain-containing protein [Paludibacter sp.]|nr:two-component regulator propeller domain-containing protein [Paludibacter sp.]
MLLRKILFERMLCMGSVLAFILCSLVLKVNAQSVANFRFTQAGLPDKAGCFLRDSRNYLWIGTDDGLYRYDGFKLKRYKNDAENPGSISGNKIISVKEDADSNIWIVPANGALCLYNREVDSFVRFKNNPSDSKSISGDVASALLIDKQHRLWVGVKGRYGLNKWDPRSKTFTHYRIIDTQNKIEVNTIYSMAQDKSGNIWIADDKLDGLFRFEPGTKKVTYYPSTSFPITTHGKDLFTDKDDMLWISTYGLGLFSFNPRNKTFTKYSSAGDGTGTNGTIIGNIIQEDDNNLLISVDHGGINRYSKKTGRFDYIVYNPQNPEGLSNDGVWGLYKDREGILWVGTSSGGVNIYNPKAHKFEHLKSIPGVQNSLSNNGVNSLYEDSKGQIWITTEGGGINVYDPRAGSFKHYQKDPKNPYSLPCNGVRYTVEDRNHDYWFGTWDGGLIKMDHRTERFTQYLPQSKIPFDISGRNIWTTMVDNDGLIWLSIWCVGIDLLDPDKGIVKKFLPDKQIEGRLYDPVIFNFYQDSHSTIWICNNMKLSMFEPATNSFKIVPVVPDGDNAVSLIEDKEGCYWLGTFKSGLIRFKRDGTVLKAYNISNGLANNAVNSILEDNYHNLWVSTGNGISKVNYKTGAIRNYTIEDGLPKGMFWQGSCLKTRSGKMYFGGSNGVNCFSPESLVKDNDYVPPVYIDEFLIFNKAVTVGQPGSPLQKVIEQTKKIVLNWDQSVFTFGFSAIDYTHPEKGQYAYKMEGFDREWNYTGASRRTATYTNLDPGEYTFRVKASNNDGVWNETGTSIKITILPPWWRTWWFITIVVLFVLCATLGYYFYRINALQKQRKKLEDVVKERTLEIEQKNEQLVVQTEKLWENRQLLLIIMDNIPQAIFWKNRNLVYLGCNRAFAADAGLSSPAEVVGKTDCEMPWKPQASLYQADDQLVIDTGKAKLNYEEPQTTPTGESIWLRTNKVPVYDSEGNVMAVLGTYEDITEAVEREKALEDAKQKAENAASSQERFLASMSHDMRTPLNGIVGMINLMEQTPLNAEQQDYMDAMKVSSSNLRVLINDILDISKIQAGKLNIESVLFDLEELLDSVEEVFKHEARKKQLEFSIGTCRGLPTMLEGDPTRLSQILNNLIGNAMKFTATGFVRLDIRHKELTDNKVQITFTTEDSGIGISSEGLSRLFQPFSQAGSDTTRKFGGSGLGLSICKSLVELQGGEIGVSSEQGKGSTFYFSIPYKVVEQQAKQRSRHKEEPLPESPQEFSGLKCLIVEDNPINQKVAFHTLKKNGIIADIANNGREAVDILRESPDEYDFILMDIQMPEMDGYQATTVIRKELCLKIPIIAMTASALKGEREHCMEVGMNDFVPKPFMISELLYVIKQLDTDVSHHSKGDAAGLGLPGEPRDEFAGEALYDMSNVLMMEDNSFTLDILNTFLESVPEGLKNLENEVSLASDWDKVSAIAHKLKGGVGILQMTRMIEQLQIIETNAKTRENLESIPHALGICARIFDEVKDEIAGIRSKTESEM